MLIDRPNVWSMVVVVGILVSSLLFLGLNPQHDDGIVGMTKKNGNGCACHSFTLTPSVHVWVTGPALVLAGSINVYKLFMTGGPAVNGGFNIAAGHGALLATNTEEKIITGELTHTAPKAFVQDTVFWTFSYQAPAITGYDTIFSVAQSVNGNDIPDNGDEWNFGDNLSVNVLPPSSALPAITQWGIAILVVMFLLGGILLIERKKVFRTRIGKIYN
jgi:hypothetical protein